jgi:hypothetical protein
MVLLPRVALPLRYSHVGVGSVCLDSFCSGGAVVLGIKGDGSVVRRRLQISVDWMLWPSY